MSTHEKKLAEFLEYLGKRFSDGPGAVQRGMHRVAFTALRPLIEDALARGYTMKATWAALRDDNRLSMTYETFRAYCRRVGISPRHGGRRASLDKLPDMRDLNRRQAEGERTTRASRKKKSAGRWLEGGPPFRPAWALAGEGVYGAELGANPNRL